MKKPKFFIYIVIEQICGFTEEEHAFKSEEDAKDYYNKMVDKYLNDSMYGNFDEDECRFFSNDRNTFVQQEDGSVWWQVYIKTLAVR